MKSQKGAGARPSRALKAMLRFSAFLPPEQPVINAALSAYALSSVIPSA